MKANMRKFYQNSPNIPYQKWQLHSRALLQIPLMDRENAAESMFSTVCFRPPVKILNWISGILVEIMGSPYMR